MNLHQMNCSGKGLSNRDINIVFKKSILSGGLEYEIAKNGFFNEVKFIQDPKIKENLDLILIKDTRFETLQKYNLLKNKEGAYVLGVRLQNDFNQYSIDENSFFKHPCYGYLVTPIFCSSFIPFSIYENYFKIITTSYEIIELKERFDLISMNM